jgi:hypothetical protein
MNIEPIQRIVLACALLLACGESRAETAQCVPIGTVPYYITAPGTYCLTKNIATSTQSGSAITIIADDVTLDCNGHTLSNSLAGNLATGVASNDTSDVVVKNCMIRNFKSGILFSTNHNNITLADNVVIRSGKGIEVSGDRVQLFDNQIIDSRAALLAAYELPWAIYVHPSAQDGSKLSRDVVIRGNRVLGMTSATYDPEGIRLDWAKSPLIEDNHVAGLEAASGLEAWGIVASSSTGALVRNNVIIAAAATSTIGLSVWGETAPAICVGNILRGISTPGFTSCALSSGNVTY